MNASRRTFLAQIAAATVGAQQQRLIIDTHLEVWTLAGVTVYQDGREVFSRSNEPKP